jgi:transcriptional regulator with XRE-family HTH domain
VVVATDSGVDETADVVDAFERLRAELGLTQKEMFKATGISKRTFHSWSDKPAGSRPRVASLGRLWELADAVDDLREALDQPLNRWLRGDNRRISALLDGRFDELVDLAVNRAPFPRREIGTSVYEGVAEYVETPIIRSGGPLVTEDVEDGFAR